MRTPSQKGPRALADLLAPGTALGRLAAEAGSRTDLAVQVRALLPEALRAGMAGCNLRPDGTLVVLATSPDWAARLRFEGDRILAACRSIRPGVLGIKMRVGMEPPTDP